jgi:hypothetical protein
LALHKKSSKLHLAKTFLPQRRKGAKKTGRNAAALSAVAPLREKLALFVQSWRIKKPD